ncbi:hypothetical protein GCM10011401_02930 [Nesterenkonia cremea]|uniref:Uncharacterized protein n=1 Tax=Nesterenkonia cremea TaxID=1882340 RepID=A0A917ALE1_9MICC|nr:hypothetical protein [Nesterenkonia cremea]GGE59560.1 hypothetical protein GCM10011401_02930 [Nesterenkonia cremea]
MPEKTVAQGRYDRWTKSTGWTMAIVLLPPLRALRMLRLVTLISALRRSAGSALRGKVTVYVFFTSLLLVLVSALAILGAGHPRRRAERRRLQNHPHRRRRLVVSGHDHHSRLR